MSIHSFAVLRRPKSILLAITLIALWIWFDTRIRWRPSTFTSTQDVVNATLHEIVFVNRPVITPRLPRQDDPIEVRQAWEFVTTPSRSDAVPNIVHFVYGLRDPEPELDMIHYFAIQSAHDVLKPDILYFHYHYLPKGVYWDRVKNYLTLRQVAIPTMIFDRSIEHYAHRADIVRLEALLEFGGIYLDLDILVLKSFEALMKEQVVMGQEGKDGWVGLCNGIIVARRNAPFIQRWYDTYRHFNDSVWSWHSVRLPGQLAPFFPNEISVLPYNAFFWPLWDYEGLVDMYVAKQYGYEHNYAVHLWESKAYKRLLAGVDEDVVKNVPTSLFCQMRRFLVDGESLPLDDECVLRAHSASPLVGSWPLSDAVPGASNAPFKIPDVSGNQLHGLGRFASLQHPALPSQVLHIKEAGYLYLNVPTQQSASTFALEWWMDTSMAKHGTEPNPIMTLVMKAGSATLVLLLRETAIVQKETQFCSLSLRVNAQVIDAMNHTLLACAPSTLRHYVLKASEESIEVYVDRQLIIRFDGWDVHRDAWIKGIWFGKDHTWNPNHSSMEIKNVRLWATDIPV